MRGSREMRVEGGGVALSWSCLPGIYSRGLNCKVLTFKGLALPVCEKEQLSARPPALQGCGDGTTKPFIQKSKIGL